MLFLYRKELILYSAFILIQLNIIKKGGTAKLFCPLSFYSRGYFFGGKNYEKKFNK
ncbi:hypothetical protein UT300002_16950 [Clostridium perfringens]